MRNRESHFAMPFTLSHPAAAIPLRRPLGRGADLVALVIGSMSPDFTYYLPVAIKRTPTHTLAALFWFCLPAGVLAYLVFDQLLKAPCAFLLPAALRRRLGEVAPHRLTAARLTAVALSVVAGAGTHIVWDSFTHGNGAVPAALPALGVAFTHIWDVPLTGYRLLQHASSLGGAIALALWLRRWYRTAPDDGRLPAAPFAETARGPIVAALLAAPLLVTLSGGVATAVGAPAGPLAPALAIAAAITTFRRAVVAALLALIAYGLLWRHHRAPVARRGAAA
jgi:hypothetical protein